VGLIDPVFALASIEVDGAETVAVVVDGHVCALDALARPARFEGERVPTTMSALLDDGDRWIDWLGEQVLVPGDDDQPWHPQADVTFLPVVTTPPTIYCAGANYFDHVRAMSPGTPFAPAAPYHFIVSRQALCAHRADVVRPRGCVALDWEVELAAVIGKRAKDVSVEKALDCVAGYTIANDLSARDAMRRELNPPTSPFHYDWVSQKCFDGACPLGPWIVPASAIRDPQNLGLKLWINDELMQDSNTGQMIFDTAEQIAMLSTRVTLQPGDVVLTGTPAGVGMGRKRFLKPGERLRLWIEGIGDLNHTVS
jgi:2-keto-4-pentenoate hydratase/2-oxohepta-3-ene-1,7-dioic acid hydratase in catechol pathway